jgi:hypothetical protein
MGLAATIRRIQRSYDATRTPATRTSSLSIQNPTKDQPPAKPKTPVAHLSSPTKSSHSYNLSLVQPLTRTTSHPYTQPHPTDLDGKP